MEPSRYALRCHDGRPRRPAIWPVDDVNARIGSLDADVLQHG